MDLEIAGRCAAVAASSSGLGFETARALADEGARVALCSRDADRVSEAASTIGRGSVGFACDLSTREGANAFIQQTEEALGPVDILVANGGGPPPGGASGIDLDALQGALDANLVAMIALVERVLPGMRERGFGRILAITSSAVREPLPNMVHSNTARAGLAAYLKTLAGEVAPDGVTVNSILPGAHDTARVRALPAALVDRLAAQIPTGRMGEARDFGRLAAMLCSGFAGQVTGTWLTVDGGAGSGT